ncbi:MAG: tetratricopeptide repeat protein, partial [Bacillota bacterium]
MNNKYRFVILIFLVIFILYSNNIISSELTTPQESFYEGDYNQAIKYYENILANDNIGEKELKNLSILYKEKGDLNRAIKLYKILLHNYPKAEYNFHLAKSYFQIANYEKSLYYFEKLINSENNLNKSLENIDNEKFYYFLGNLYLKINKLNKAENTFIKGIEENNNFHLNYLALANLYNDKNNYDLAIEYYKKAINRDRNITQVYPKIAQNYEEIDDIESSYSYWQKSKATNEKRNFAQSKIEEFQTKYPYLKEKEDEKKKFERSQIDWKSINPVINEENLKNVRVGIVDNVNEIYFQSNNDFKIIIDNKNIDGKNNVEYKIERNN